MKNHYYVSKLFRAYGLYNNLYLLQEAWLIYVTFQSSFELTGYITYMKRRTRRIRGIQFQSSFELTGYITAIADSMSNMRLFSFKALSSLRVI